MSEKHARLDGGWVPPIPPCWVNLPKVRTNSNGEDPKNEDYPRKEDNPQNEEDNQKEDDPKN